MKLDKSVELRKLEVKRLHILRQIRDCRQQSAVAEAPGAQESDGNTNIDAQSTESTPKPIRTSIAELHNQYNELINQRAILQRGCGPRFSDPLEVLPTEIWIECLNLVLADEIAVNGNGGSGNGYYNASQGVYHLLLVSKSWWTKLLNVPSLWSTILVDGDPDVLYRLTAGLYFSGTLPLTIIIELPFVETPSMTEVTDVTSTEAYKILTEPQVKSRIRRIIFQQSLQSRRAHRDGNDAPFITFYDTAFSLLRPFQHLPELEAVQMRHSFDYYSRTLLEEGFPVSPRLRGVYRWCLPAITLEGIIRNLSKWNSKEHRDNADDDHTMQELRHLSTNMTVEQACRILPRLPKLEHLMLTSPHAMEPFAAQSIYNTQTYPELMEMLSKSSITMVECSQLVAPGSHPIFHIPSLTVLCLDLTWPSLSRFLGSFTSLPNLHRLELGMKESDDESVDSSPLLEREMDTSSGSLDTGQVKADKFTLPSILPDLSSVRVLILQNYDTEWTIGDSDSDSRKTPSPMFSTLLRAGAAMLPGVKELTVTFRIKVSLSPLLEYLKGIQNCLENLVVSGTVDTTDAGEEVVPLYALKHLTIFNSAILGYIDTPYLQTLTGTDHHPPRSQVYKIKAGPDLQELTLHPALAVLLKYLDMSGLKTLNWVGGSDEEVAFPTLGIPSLQKIKFGSEAIMPEVLKFLESLVKEPSQLPNLETLAFGGYPAFDLLLRVLERRNMASDISESGSSERCSGESVEEDDIKKILDVKPITTILLPGYPAPDTLSSIVRLLGQKLGPPDEAEGVSFSYDERYFNNKIPGCHYCFASGWRCKTEVHEKYYSFVEQFNPEPEPTPSESGPDPGNNNASDETRIANPDATQAATIVSPLTEQSSESRTEEGTISIHPEIDNESLSTIKTVEIANDTQLSPTPVATSSATSSGSPLPNAIELSAVPTTSHEADQQPSLPSPAKPVSTEPEIKVDCTDSSTKLSTTVETDNTSSSEPKTEEGSSETPKVDANQSEENTKEPEKKGEGEWMSEWWRTYQQNEKRFREWTSKYYREGFCLRHDPDSLVLISQDTLQGTKIDWWDSYDITESPDS